MERIFVYGTLKQRFSNHSAFLIGQKFLGTGCTRRKFSLYQTGSLPFLVDIPVSPIGGEIYEVDNKCLENIDQLEGHPDWYKRKKILVCIPSTGKCVECWTYFVSSIPQNSILIKTGNYNPYPLEVLRWK